MLPALPRKYHAASIWLLYAVGLAPAAYGFWLGATGRLPGNPVKEFEHLLGLWALRFLVATLAITPLRDLFGINWIRYRRALGPIRRQEWRAPRCQLPSAQHWCRRCGRIQ